MQTEQTTNPKILADLKPGDEVIVEGRYDKHIEAVEKVTKLHVILPRSGKFRIKDGYSLRGGIWNREVIRIPKPGDIEAIHNERKRINLRYTVEELFRVKKDTLTIDQLRAILEILK